MQSMGQRHLPLSLSLPPLGVNTHAHAHRYLAGEEASDVQAVLDGGLDPFMISYLRLKGQRVNEEALSKL